MKEEYLHVNNTFRPWNMELNSFCMLMHLSQFAGCVIPAGGIILPIVMWASNKDQSEVIDKHGKSIINWMLSSIIYIIISVVLVFILVGIFTLLTVVFASIIFAIIGSVKASNGEIYEYPFSIKFLK